MHATLLDIRLCAPTPVLASAENRVETVPRLYLSGTRVTLPEDDFLAAHDECAEAKAAFLEAARHDLAYNPRAWQLLRKRRERKYRGRPGVTPGPGACSRQAVEAIDRMPPAIMNADRLIIEEEGTVADIWVLTQPTDDSRKRGFIRAHVITSVSGDTHNVLAVRSDTQAVVSLAAGVTTGGKSKPLPAGFHVYFLQTLDEARRDKSSLAKVVMARSVVDQEEWQRVVEASKTSPPRDF